MDTLYQKNCLCKEAKPQLQIQTRDRMAVGSPPYIDLTIAASCLTCGNGTEVITVINPRNAEMKHLITKPGTLALPSLDDPVDFTLDGKPYCRCGSFKTKHIFFTTHRATSVVFVGFWETTMPHPESQKRCLLFADCVTCEAQYFLTFCIDNEVPIRASHMKPEQGWFTQ